MMRLVFRAIALATILIAGQAAAADLPTKAPKAPPPLYNWSGFYLGVNAGGAWGKFDTTTSTIFSPIGYFATTSVPAINAAGAHSIKPTAFVGGGQAGFNWQAGNIVFGGEVDFQSFHLSGSAAPITVVYPCCAPTAFTLTSSAHTDWLFTARPRIGFATNNWLFYATGGLAVTHLNGSFGFTDTFATASESATISKTKAGYAVGGGIEAGLWGGWSLKAEYLHVNFGTVTTTSANLTAFNPPIAFPANVFTHSVDLKANIARIGLNYRFGGPISANY